MRRTRGPETLPAGVLEWRDSGRFVDVDGHWIFVVDQDGSGSGDAPPVVIVHGFPGSSYDWRAVAASVAAHRRVVVFDLLGYGLSAKPLAARYSLFEQADLVEALLERCRIGRCSLVAHDMGDTVTAELLARHNEGRLSFGVDRVMLTNGSIFIDLVQLSRGQKLGLTLPDRPLPAPIPGPVLRRSLLESFSPDAPPPPGAIVDMIALIRYGGGGRLLPRQMRYIGERRANQPRWTAAFLDFPGPLTALWGELDPIAVVAMAHRLADLRPATEVVTWPDVGHWPSIEAPERVSEAILQRM